MFTYFRTCSCIFRRCFSSPSRSCCTTSIQSGEVDNCFSISYCFTITIIVCQCNFLSRCIIFIYVFSTCCIKFTTFNFSGVSFYRSWSNMKFISSQCFSSIMKVRYINCCILNIRVIISCCFQFIQVCSSLTCRHCWSLVFNSRTNIVNNHATIFCCLASGCFRVFKRSDDIASIFCRFTFFMEFTVFIFC